MTGSDVVAEREPEVAVIVAVPLTGAAVAAAVSVKTLVAPEEGFGENEAVTPLGKPLTA